MQLAAGVSCFAASLLMRISQPAIPAIAART